MSAEFLRDIPRTWVEQQTPRADWPQLQPGTVYGILPSQRHDPNSREVTSPESRRVADEVECELTPGFERHIRESRQLKSFYVDPTPLDTNEAILTGEDAMLVRMGIVRATTILIAKGILPNFGDYISDQVA